MNIFKTLFCLAILGMFLTSCLTNSQENDVSNQLILTLEFSGINNEIVAEGDTIRVLTLKFLYGRTALQNNNNDTLVVNDNVQQINHQVSNDETKGLASGPFESDEVYDLLAFEIKQAEQSDIDEGGNFEADTFIEGESDDQRYSMIMQGSYNNNGFEFKSTRNFNFEFLIQDNSGGSQQGLVYQMHLQANVQQWFLNSEGDGLLNPNSVGNASAINDNIQQSMNIN